MKNKNIAGLHISFGIRLDTLLRQAELTFEKAMGDRVALCDPVLIKDGIRCLVMRCRAQSDNSSLSSLIIKHIKSDTAPDKATNQESVRGFCDWASLSFLSALPQAQDIVPRFYGGDAESRIFLMEDLGAGQSLHDLLHGTDGKAARAALQTLATQMARLHAATQGQEELFEATRAALPQATGQAAGLGRHEEAKAWLENRDKLLEWFHALDCAPPVGWEACLNHIAHTYRQAEGFLGFTHGDPAPSNNHFVRRQEDLHARFHAHLLDFEYGAFRHVLYDITAWNILCPLPDDCVRAMNQCFRDELAKSYRAARDEVYYNHDWACLCAYRALAILTWIPPAVLAQNRPWADEWTMREAVLCAVSRLEQAAAPCEPLQPIREAAATLTTALRARWPEYQNTPIPRWPALQDLP